tara:strand:- start:237 stop:701 length:465 start_codon:yes stop_codon:yes gene_type:complete
MANSETKTFITYNRDVTSNEVYSSITSIGSTVLASFLSSKSGPPESPERLLFLSVIYQAILDATMDEEEDGSCGESVKNKEEALAWFFEEKHLDDLTEICFLVGAEHDRVRKIVRQILNKEIPFSRKRINVLINELKLKMNVVDEEDEENYELS